MTDGNSSLALLNGVSDLFERFQSTIMLTGKEKDEIIDTVYDAIIETELFFGKVKSRKIGANQIIAKSWSKAGKTIIKYLPNESLGIWLQNKGEAWANSNKWDEEILKKNRLQIEQIKKRISALTETRRKFFRPKNI